MAEADLDKLVDGYRRFREGAYQDNRAHIESLIKEGQRPRIAVVACSDSRVDPAILFQTDPGDLFMLRNVANLVPPFEEESSYHGTSAALEFAVLGLGVKHIVVLGHAQCGGIQLMMNPNPDDSGFQFVPPWVSQLKQAHLQTQAAMPDAGESELTRQCEQNAVLVSLANLATFPWVRERVDNGELELHGWYIDISGPELSAYDPESGQFRPIKAS